MLIIALSGAGLAVSAGVLWLQLVQGSNERAAAAQAAVSADHYAGLIDARVAELRAQMAAIAAAPDTVAAVSSADADDLQRLNTQLTDLLPFADRVDVIPSGAARLDQDAEVPISYAALDLIERAEREPFAGPEGIRLDNRRNRFYAARPVMASGIPAGVLFVAMSADFLLTPLQTVYQAGAAAAPADAGRVTLEQTFEGLEPVTLLQWGDHGQTGSSQRISRELSVPHWRLLFEPSDAAGATVASALDLLTAFAAAVGLLLAGVLFAFSSLSRNFRHDAAALVTQMTSAVQGRRQQPQRFRLAIFYDLARDIGGLAQPARGAAPPDRRDPAAATQDQADAAAEDAVEELLEDEVEAAPKRKRPAASDDFLEVSSGGDAGDNFGIEVTEDTSPMAMGLDLQAEIFRSYDIRGITTSNLTEEVVYWIGRAFAAEAAEQGHTRVAVGRDGRHSSAGLRDALARGLNEGGADVLDIGQVPTPVLYFATHVLDTGTGVMITGSHNPPEYNGLKMMIGGVTLAEERIQALRQRIEDNRLSEGDGDIESVDIAGQYVDRIVDDVVVAQPLKVVVDCGNGVAGALAPTLLSQLGCEVVPLYCEVDGDFPNHHPDPAEPANLEDLITVVRAEEADLGLAFDGDGDRLGVVTASGEIIWPDKLLMLYAQDIVARNPGADIIYDVKCSRHLNSLIGDLGGRPIMWKTGHSHIKAKLKETGALLAGEFSGHICFGERWYGFDDALYAAARLLEILGGTDASADETFAQFPVTYGTPELKIQTTEQLKFEILERLSIDGDFGDGTITTIDGLRVDYADGWGLIRPSNTSPVLSLRFEADGQEALDRIQDVFQAQLTAVDPELRFR
ncbi:MAG: phosphomannomutase/phosphoglucomutase [Gammaproteobacteria bacterium]|nr:phosphomannomutase/phosphoglucomutase [Gammaproteobacteria bacterium]